MKWLVWILVFGLVGCASMPEHRPNCEPVPTRAGRWTSLAVGVVFAPSLVGILIPWAVARAERNRLWAAYPECKGLQGFWGNEQLLICVRKIDIREGRWNPKTHEPIPPLAHCATEQKATVQKAIPEEKCDAPVWKVGDSWRYKNDDKKEWEYEVLGVEDFKNTKIYVVQDRYGFYKKGFDIRTFQLKVDISPDGKKILPTTDWDWFYDFPLYVGKNWKKMTTGKDAGGNLRDYVFSYKVLWFENVTVPAGTFRAFKIERTQADTVQLGNTFVTYLWYCPEVKREVKFELGPVSGSWRVTRQGHELKSYKLAEKQAIPSETKSSIDKTEGATKPQVSP